jgi:cell wall-associated NlpC family hydrolase
MAMIKNFLILCNFLIFSSTTLTADDLSGWRQKVVEAARNLTITNQTFSGKTWYNRDCSGTVYAAFEAAGYPLGELILKNVRPNLNGTAILNEICRSNPGSSLVTAAEIQPGDLVFFDNTFDKNQNGHSDDTLTHVAIITEFDEKSGNVSFVHYNTFHNKILEERMNLRHRTDKNLNIILRWPAQNDPQQERYAAELINSFGTLF